MIPILFIKMTSLQEITTNNNFSLLLLQLKKLFVSLQKL